MINCTKIFTQIKASLHVIKDRKLVELYMKHLTNIMNLKLNTLIVLLRKPSIIKLGISIMMAIEENQEAIDDIKEEAKRFIEACNITGFDESQREPAGTTLGKIWNVPTEEPEDPADIVEAPEDLPIYDNSKVWTIEALNQEKYNDILNLMIQVNARPVDFPERKESISHINRWIENGKFSLAKAELEEVVEAQNNLRIE